ncbi:MAG: site-2 protease family protein [Anaerolineae bacterium]|nr:site-2 protease family protein [Anaerolineae bacterium]
MGWSLRIGRIFGIDIKVHLTFLLILVWGAFSYGGNAGPWYGMLVTLAIFTLVLLHELGHSVAAKGFGISVRDITLLPIGGIARLERMPKKPVQELIVAVAGPLVNVILALILLPLVVGLMIGQSIPFSLRLMTQPGMLGLLTFLLGANISLVVFNMIPAFPLDGGRVFRAMLGFFTDYYRATKIAVTVGRVFAFGLGLFAILSMQFWLAIIALFIFMAGSQEGLVAATRGKLRQWQVGQVLGRNPISLPPYATVGQVAPVVMGSYQANFPVLDPTNGQLLGFTTNRKVAQAMAQGQGQQPLTEVMQPVHNVPVVGFYARLDEVLEKLAETPQRVAAVYDGLHFRGLISLEDIQRVFQFLPRRRGEIMPQPKQL